MQDTGLYYDRYLREVIDVLETDPHFREKLQTANTEDIKVSSRVYLHLEGPPFSLGTSFRSPRSKVPSTPTVGDRERYLRGFCQTGSSLAAPVGSEHGDLVKLSVL